MHLMKVKAVVSPSGKQLASAVSGPVSKMKVMRSKRVGGPLLDLDAVESFIAVRKRRKARDSAQRPIRPRKSFVGHCSIPHGAKSKDNLRRMRSGLRRNIFCARTIGSRGVTILISFPPSAQPSAPSVPRIAGRKSHSGVTNRERNHDEKTSLSFDSRSGSCRAATRF